MKYNFDEIINRYGTYCIKYDGLKNIVPTANENTIPLFVADMDLKTSQPIIDAMHRVADFGMWGYSSTDAEPNYNKAVIRWFKDKHNLDINPEEITYSNGTIEAINSIIKAFSKVGDGIILCRPVYGHFTECIEEDTHRKVVDCHLIKDENDDYVLNYEDIEKKCSISNNRILIMSSPHNPIGRVWKKEELNKLAKICKRYNVLLVSDEVHCDIVRKNIIHTPIYNAVDDYSNIIMLTAINKTFNLAGLQCSNVIIKDKFLRDRFLNEFGHRSPTPFTLAALIAAYTESDEWLDQVNDYIDENIDFTIHYLKKNIPWVKVKKPEGTYCLWLDFSECGLSGEEIHTRIYEKANVILQDGIVHDPKFGQYCQRVCVPVARSILKQALDRIKEQF